MSARIKVFLMVIAFVCFSIWFLHVTSRNQTEAQKTDIASKGQDASAEPEPPPITPETPIGNIKKYSENQDKVEKLFKDEYSKLVFDSEQENLRSMKPEIDSYLDDLTAFHEISGRNLRSCISASNDNNVEKNCFFAQFNFNSSWSFLGIESILKELPNVSQSQLESANNGWERSVEKDLSYSAHTLEEIRSNQELAGEYGTSEDLVGPIFQRARGFEARALTLDRDDGALALLLFNHASLLLEDFKIKTLKYRFMQDKRRPLLQ